jgi:hypothetical protein
VAYDADLADLADLADRIREIVSAERRVTEKRMFGGLAFLLDGNMAVAASGHGEYGGDLRRPAPDGTAALAAALVRVALDDDLFERVRGE